MKIDNNVSFDTLNVHYVQNVYKTTMLHQLKTKIPFMTTTRVRQNIADFVEQIKRENSVIGIGRRNKIEVMVMKYPENINVRLAEITNINANSSSFDFLKDEPDLYTVKDLKKRHV